MSTVEKMSFSHQATAAIIMELAPVSVRAVTIRRTGTDSVPFLAMRSPDKIVPTLYLWATARRPVEVRKRGLAAGQKNDVAKIQEIVIFFWG
jgi:hypothetical protein